MLFDVEALNVAVRIKTKAQRKSVLSFNFLVHENCLKMLE
jgi:hypothetical protein